jgi:OFA family oxalate/formate antiporter-like MFS transporter
VDDASRLLYGSPIVTHSSHPGSPKALARFPFNPARLPFFYGFGVLFVGTLGILASAPGQTVGVSVFTDHLIDALAISRTELSLTYLLGTVLSALLLAQTGRLYDFFGGRVVATGSALILSLVLFGLTAVPGVAATLGGGVPALVVMTLGFFLLRFSGQGMLNLASRNMVMEWLDERRGLANAFMGISISFGFSAAPRLFDALIGGYGWQGAWRILAVGIVIFAGLAFLFYRDTPEAHGLLPDGPLRGRGRRQHAETSPGRSFTVSEARRTYTFWLFALTLVLTGLVMTAYTFHIVSIFDDAGMSRSRAVGVFLPAAVVAVVVEIGGSYISDFIRLKYLAMVQLGGLMVLTASIAALGMGGAAYPGLIVGMGVMQGMFGIMANVTWPRFFGRGHLGAVAGFAMALNVAGTAVGPYAFSFARDLTGGYAVPAVTSAAIGAVLFVGATRANRPEHPGSAKAS